VSPSADRTALLLAAGVLGILAPACADAEDTVPVVPPAPVVAHVSYAYTTNVYVGSLAPVAPESTEVGVCEALFAKSSACVRSLTTDPDALERFDRRLEVSRREGAVIEAAGDGQASRERRDRCATALRAYDTAPCGG